MSRRRNRPKRRQQTNPYLDIPFQSEIRNAWPPYQIATPDQIEQIHNASMQILENTGIRFLDDEAIALWEAAGAKVDHKTQHVWLDRGLITELVAQAPSSFTFRARNPVRNRFIGENAINFFSAAGTVFAHDLKRGRRPGLLADWINIAKLIQMTNVIHFGPLQVVVQHDVPVYKKHLVQHFQGTILSDKPLMGVSHGRIIPTDVLEMTKILFGPDLQPELGPVTGGIINANSPLVYDDRMLGGMITFARAGQFLVITPFILAGAMSPVTMAAAIAQQNAEALAGIAFLQLVRPGTPAIYGGFTTNVDMRSGAPAFGTPEGAWAFFIGAQLARHYGLPYRGSGSLNTANLPDGQAMSESLWSLWPCVLAHANLVHHAAGWLESGLVFSLEKFIMDVENLAMIQHMLHGPEWSEDAFGLSAIDEVGPAGHHFGTAHTQARYQTAFYPNFLHDRRNFGTWQEAGGKDAAQRAHKIWQSVLKAYERPPIDPAIETALQEFVTRRAKELENVALYD
ncbi:trimethylamine methyltransferase family protein [Candidatus Leptofilum sp.]|uniref:trimethylamine methyltransferase family protein n=1 Tax=Candidatus Leptofilum sp. TaxID=3241576 RepID=UPI003B5B3956